MSLVGALRRCRSPCSRAFSSGVTARQTSIERQIELSEHLRRETTERVRPMRLRGGTGVFSLPTSSSLPALGSAAGARASGSGAGKDARPTLPREKRMKDTVVQLDLNFEQEPGLLESYMGAREKVRMGRLMEEFDSIAGASAYRFMLPPSSNPSDAKSYGFHLVTASVDRMDMLHSLYDAEGKVRNLRLSGHVSYASTSSLEVFVRLSVIPRSSGTNGAEEPGETLLVGRFAMVSRNTLEGGKFPMPNLVVEGPAEQELWEMGKEIKQRKLAGDKQSVWVEPPSVEESRTLHELFMGRGELFVRNAPLPPSIVWMSTTKSNSTLLMHPQERNVHSKIFGGHIMRVAYESAYATGALFALPEVGLSFVALDSIRFLRPVEVGELLTLQSQIAYAPMDLEGEHKSFLVSVEASTTNLHTGESHLTNTFSFTFSSDRPLTRYVLPRSYRSAMLWLDGQRRRQEGIDARRAYFSE